MMRKHGRMRNSIPLGSLKGDFWSYSLVSTEKKSHLTCRGVVPRDAGSGGCRSPGLREGNQQAGSSSPSHPCPLVGSESNFSLQRLIAMLRQSHSVPKVSEFLLISTKGWSVARWAVGGFQAEEATENPEASPSAVTSSVQSLVEVFQAICGNDTHRVPSPGSEGVFWQIIPGFHPLGGDKCIFQISWKMSERIVVEASG